MALKRKTQADESAVFSGFTDVKEIGGGGFATVYSARETDTGRPVALKLLNIRDAPPHALESFRRETLALGSLSAHPNIVTLYRTMSSTDGRPVLVMELCKESVYQRAKTAPPPMQQSVSLAIKIAGALETAHSAGMLHRDVKPQNILLTHYDEPALADFGVARLQSSSEATAGVFGFTTIHAAPEMLEGAVATAATDVYELASTLYQLLEGRAAFRTFDGEAPASVILRILRDPVPPLSATDAPIALSDLLVSAMAKSPEERPSSAADFAEALNDIERAQGWPLTHFAVVREPAAPAAVDAVSADPPAEARPPSTVPPVPIDAAPASEVAATPAAPAPTIAAHHRVTPLRPVAPTPVRARQVVTPQARPPKVAGAAPPVAPPPPVAASSAAPVSHVHTPEQPARARRYRPRHRPPYSRSASRTPIRASRRRTTVSPTSSHAPSYPILRSRRRRSTISSATGPSRSTDPTPTTSSNRRSSQSRTRPTPATPTTRRPPKAHAFVTRSNRSSAGASDPRTEGASPTDGASNLRHSVPMR